MNKSWIHSIANKTRSRRKLALVATLITLTSVYLLSWATGSGLSYSGIGNKNHQQPQQDDINNNNNNEIEEAYIPGRDMTDMYGELQSPPWAISNAQDVPANLRPDDNGGDQHQQIGTENAAMIMLVRNSELEDAVHSILEVERTFNHRYRYPWVFMNDIPFTPEFKEEIQTKVSSTCEFVQIPHQYWSVPEWIDVDAMMEGMAKLKEKNVPYADLLSYRHMCRFNSGFFFNLDALKKYTYYWRVEPAVNFYCDLTYDPFTFLRENNLMYGFVMAVYEFGSTIPTLWDTVVNFTRQYPEMVAVNNTIDLIVDGAIPNNPINETTRYNNCHFWSNFEIGNLDFFRSPQYTQFFDYLDKSNGFFYERWGDAPVHTLALSLLLDRSQIHHFGDIGYTHSAYTHCPVDPLFHKSPNPLCSCSKKQSADFDNFSCLDRWWKARGKSLGDMF